MVLLDPFYGVSDTGVKITRWMNRTLLVAEVVAIVYSVFLLIRDAGFPGGTLLFTPLILMLGIHITNTVTRWIWNVVMVIIYGTTDVDVIADAYARKAEKRKRKAAAEVEARKAKEIEMRRSKETLVLPESRVDYGPDYQEQPKKIVTDMFL